MAEPYIGLDFGTTNTVLSGLDKSGKPFLYRFSHDGRDEQVFRSALCFWQESGTGVLRNRHDAGPGAMARVIESPADFRFIQSFKTFAASSLFDTTKVFGTSLDFSDLLYLFLERYFEMLRPNHGALPDRVIIGRPVQYAGTQASAELARQRYDAALQRLGFTEIHHVYEPVAAAYHFAQRLKDSATILVGDFGGGTSDFSVIRFAKDAGGISADPLAHAGVGIAGDNFDYRIIDNLVAPAFGKGTTYKSWGDELELPKSYFGALGRWDQLSVMAGTKTFSDLCNLARSSTEPEKVGLFIRFIEEELGFNLYRSVATAKTALTTHPAVDFQFDEAGIRLAGRIERCDFESWIDPELTAIDACIDEALDNAGLQPPEIDKVFLTGGTSLVPAVRRLFEARFSPEKIESGEELLSVASGLALVGNDRNLERWTI